jgi:hypothetical protein
MNHKFFKLKNNTEVENELDELSDKLVRKNMRELDGESQAQKTEEI